MSQLIWLMYYFVCIRDEKNIRFELLDRRRYFIVKNSFFILKPPSSIVCSTEQRRENSSRFQVDRKSAIKILNKKKSNLPMIFTFLSRPNRPFE